MGKREKFGSATVNGTTLRDLMKRRGVFPDELADQAKVSLRLVQKMMAGGRSNLAYIERVARALGSDIDQLTNGLGQVHSYPPIVQGNIKFSGAMTEFAPDILMKITKEFAELLMRYGLTVTQYDCQLALTELYRDQIARVIVLVYGILEGTGPFWCYVAVKPSRYNAFLQEQKDGTLNLLAFAPYGEIIISGEGHDVPEDVTAKVAEVYQTDPKEFFTPMDVDAVLDQKVSEYESKHNTKGP